MASASDRVQVIGPGRTYVGKQGFAYGAGASTETVGAERISMNVLPVPVGGRAKVHYNQGIETIAYLLEGECVVYYGERLERQFAVRAGKRSTYRPMSRMRRRTKAARPAPGSWFTPQEAIRMGSFSCPISTRSSVRGRHGPELPGAPSLEKSADQRERSSPHLVPRNPGVRQRAPHCQLACATFYQLWNIITCLQVDTISYRCHNLCNIRNILIISDYMQHQLFSPR